MSYAGDFALGSTIDIKFTTRQFSTGAPFTLAGTPAVAAYPDNSTTEITAGITLTVDFDARTGLNNVRVVATGANGYAAGSSYALVITAGTVDGVSVVGEVVGSFTLERSASFARLGAPAGASVSADIAAIQADTNDIQGRLPAALVGGRIDASIGAAQANTLTASALAADAVAEIADGVWDEARAGHVTAGTFGEGVASVQGNVTGSVGSVATGGITAASIATDAIDADAIAASAVTEIQSGLSTLTAAEVNAEIVDALSVDTYAEPGLGAPPATATLVQKIGYLYKAWRNRTTQTATTYTLYGDDATTAHQATTVSDDGTTFDRGEIGSG